MAKQLRVLMNNVGDSSWNRMKIENLLVLYHNAVVTATYKAMIAAYILYT